MCGWCRKHTEHRRIKHRFYIWFVVWLMRGDKSSCTEEREKGGGGVLPRGPEHIRGSNPELPAAPLYMRRCRVPFLWIKQLERIITVRNHLTFKVAFARSDIYDMMPYKSNFIHQIKKTSWWHQISVAFHSHDASCLYAPTPPCLHASNF